MNSSSFQINLAKLTDASHWTRIILTVLFLVVLRFALLAIQLIAALQIISSLLTTKPNCCLTGWAKMLSTYIDQITHFVTYQNDVRPFPFSPWPN